MRADICRNHAGEVRFKSNPVEDTEGRKGSFGSSNGLMTALAITIPINHVDGLSYDLNVSINSETRLFVGHLLAGK